MIEFLIIANSEPYQLGVYQDKILIKSFCKNGKAANCCPEIIKEALLEFNSPKNVYFAAGPGNLTSLKIGYISAKTLSIACNVDFFGISSFAFNDNCPISAFGKKTFVQDGVKILVSDESAVMPKLPQALYGFDFIKDKTPIYPLPSVS